VRPSHVIKDGDLITIKNPPFPTVDEVIAEIGKRAFDIITVVFNDKAVTIRKPRLTLTLNGHNAEVSAIVKPGDRLDFVSLSESPITFGDIFAFTDYSLPENPSSNYKLLQNGIPIGFNDAIFGGDKLEISFT
jgi:hypothetical protein